MTPMALALGILAITIICFIWEPFPIVNVNQKVSHLLTNF